MSTFRFRTRIVLLASVTLLGINPGGPPAFAASAKAGKPCKTAGQTATSTTGSLLCTKKSGKLIWTKSTPTTTQAGSKSASPTVVASTSPVTVKSTNGIDGTWKVTSGSAVGYRVKEVLQGQETEGVGRTNSITGTLTIQGTTVTAAELTADLTTLKSDSARRDDQVQTRILETAKFPNAVIKLLAPIQLDGVPANKVELSKTAKIALTLHGVTKEISVEVGARRNGDNLEITGAIKIVFADYGITNPSLPPLVTTDPEGLLEFLIVFGR